MAEPVRKFRCNRKSGCWRRVEFQFAMICKTSLGKKELFGFPICLLMKAGRGMQLAGTHETNSVRAGHTPRPLLFVRRIRHLSSVELRCSVAPPHRISIALADRAGHSVLLDRYRLAATALVPAFVSARPVAIALTIAILIDSDATLTDPDVGLG